jgi:hypothetical protein
MNNNQFFQIKDEGDSLMFCMTQVGGERITYEYIQNIGSAPAYFWCEQPTHTYVSYKKREVEEIISKGLFAEFCDYLINRFDLAMNKPPSSPPRGVDEGENFRA